MALGGQMMQRDNELERFLRRSLCEAADSVAIGSDGLEKIRARLAGVRLAGVRRSAAADRGEPHQPRMARRPLVLAGVSWQFMQAGSAGTRT
jgi:hypothetical protein